MASLVDQIFAQAQLGTAVDTNANPFATGVQLGQNQQRIDQSKQQLAMELAQLPLKQTLLQQDAEMNQFKLATALTNRQEMVANEGTLASLSGQIYNAMQEGTAESAEPLLFEALSRNPKLLNDPRFKQLRDDLTTSINAKLELQRLKAGSVGFTPSFGTATNPITGQPEAFFQTSPNSAQLVKAPGDAPLSPLGKLMADRNAALKANDTLAVANYDAEIKARQSKEGFSLTTNPDGTFTLSQGAPSTLTPTNTTRVQESLLSALNGIDVANRLEPLISTETVGVQAFAESWVKDRILAQRFPAMASGRRATAEALAADLRATSIQQLKSDGNISEKERAQILQAVPEINSPIDSPARAKQLIGATRRMSAIRAIVAANKLGQPVPVAAAQVLPASELKRLVDTGVLTPLQAAAAYNAANPQ